MDFINKVKLENIKVSTRINEDCTLIDVKTQVDLEIAKLVLLLYKDNIFDCVMNSNPTKKG